MKKIILLLGAGYFLISGMHAQFMVTVDTSKKFQIFRGFGAAHTINYNFSDYSLRREFDNFPKVNVRFGVFGDTNFITSKAQLDSNVYDFTKSEMYRCALYLKEAKKWGLNRAVIGVFSPPGWMKSGGRTLCYPCTDAENYLLPEHYADFAKWIGIIVKEIIKITGDLDLWLSIQMEPRFQEEWPKCIYTPSRYADVLKVVGDYFQTNDTMKKINFFGPTDMARWEVQVPWMDTLLVQKPDAGAYLKGWGNQGYIDGVNPDISDSSTWTAFAKKIIDENHKELWMSSGAIETGTDFVSALHQLGEHAFLALKSGRVSCFHYWGITMFFSGDRINQYGQVFKQIFRFIRPGYQQFETVEKETQFLMMGFMKGENITLCFFNENSSQAKTFEMDKSLAPFYHMYTINSQEQSCVYKGKVSGTTFTVKPLEIMTLYYNAEDTAAIYAPVPPVLKVKAVTENSVTVTWNPSRSWTMKGVKETYEVPMVPGYKLMRDYVTSTIQNTNDTTFTFTKLKPCTTYTLVLIVQDSMFNSAYSSIKVTTDGTNCQQVQNKDAGNEAALTVYPNPATESIAVVSSEDLAGASYAIINRMGNCVSSGVITGPHISVSDLAGGLYVIRITGRDKVWQAKFIKM